MQGCFYAQRNGFLFFIITIIFITQFIICHLVITVVYIIGNINIIVFVLAAVIFFFRRIKFFLRSIFIKLIVASFFSNFKRRVFFQLFLYPLVKNCGRYLQQL